MLHAVRVMNYFAQSLVCQAVMRARRQRGGSRLQLAVNRHSVDGPTVELKRRKPNPNVHRIHEPRLANFIFLLYCGLLQ